jgi:hypothetical protein
MSKKWKEAKHSFKEGIKNFGDAAAKAYEQISEDTAKTFNQLTQEVEKATTRNAIAWLDSDNAITKMMGAYAAERLAKNDRVKQAEKQELLTKLAADPLTEAQALAVAQHLLANKIITYDTYAQHLDLAKLDPFIVTCEVI